jgi:STE24 endopeptidase
MTPITASPIPEARRYARIRYRLLLIDLASWFLFLAAFLWWGGSQATVRWWSARVAAEPLRLLGYLAVVSGAYYLLMFPLHCYGSFHLEHRFGLSRLTVWGWVKREAKQLVVSAVLGASLIEGLYALLRYAPTSWPLWATLGWVVFTIVLARVFPTLLLPIFYKTSPLQDEALVHRLLELCRRVGLSALGVFRFDLGAETRKANAALAGLGKTRRVLLSDTLLAEFTPEEIEGVLAHELAHHRYHHITKLLLLSAVGSWLAFTLTQVAGDHWVAALGLRSLADMAGFPMLMLWLSALGLIGLPLQNAISRSFEWQADHFAVDTTHRTTAFASALRRLAALNLADPDPPRWVVRIFYDHPPITQRIKAAEVVNTS